MKTPVMPAPSAITFFDTQFQRQVREADFALNPFEQLALDYVAGSVLDYGCGLGNLSLAAARRGCRVVAIDGSATAAERIRTTAAREQLAVEAICADLGDHRIERGYDTIVAIGLLMFSAASARWHCSPISRRTSPPAVARLSTS